MVIIHINKTIEVNMTLEQSKIGDKLTIIKLNGDDSFKQRVYSFGLIESTNLEIINISLAKQTIQIENEDGTLIALRFSEAKNIEVTK